MENSSQHFVGNVAQKAIIERDSKILVCRGVGDTLWEFPGGRLHDGEEPVDGIRREVMEELGVRLATLTPIAAVRSFHNQSKSWQVLIAYRCSLTDTAEPIADGAELEEIRWVTPEELKTLEMFSGCREAADIYFETKSPGL